MIRAPTLKRQNQPADIKFDSWHHFSDETRSMPHQLITLFLPFSLCQHLTESYTNCTNARVQEQFEHHWCSSIRPAPVGLHRAASSSTSWRSHCFTVTTLLRTCITKQFLEVLKQSITVMTLSSNSSGGPFLKRLHFHNILKEIKIIL